MAGRFFTTSTTWDPSEHQFTLRSQQTIRKEAIGDSEQQRLGKGPFTRGEFSTDL